MARPGPRTRLGVLLAAVALAGSACSGASADTDTDTAAGYTKAITHAPYAVDGAALTDTDGKPYSLVADTDKAVTLVFFGYTNCPDICQIVMSTIASAVARLSSAQRAQLQVAFVTTDPARDTRPVLRTYLDRFNPDFIGVTGSLDQIDALAKPMDVFVKKGQKLPDGGYEVDHSTVVIAVRHARGDLVWTGATSPSDMAADLKKILKADA